MTEQDLRDELDTIQEKLLNLEKPKESGNAHYSRLQGQLDELALQVEAHNRVLKSLLPEFGTRYEESYSELKKHAEENGQADYERW